MPTYAILGATGQTGVELVKQLLPSQNHLNIYARSASRLELNYPSLSSAHNVTTFIGDLSDTKLLASCLEGTDVVFSVVAQNQNEPGCLGCPIAQRTALAIIQALDGRKAPYPLVIFLASAAIDPRSEQNKTWPLRLFYYVNYYIYEDLHKAIQLFHIYPHIPLIVAAPGALVQGESHHVDIASESEKGSQIVPYGDLAKGMIIMAERGKGELEGKYVGVVVNRGEPIESSMLHLIYKYLLPNLLARRYVRSIQRYEDLMVKDMAVYLLGQGYVREVMTYRERLQQCKGKWITAEGYRSRLIPETEGDENEIDRST